MLDNIKLNFNKKSNKIHTLNNPHFLQIYFERN